MRLLCLKLCFSKKKKRANNGKKLAKLELSGGSRITVVFLSVFKIVTITLLELNLVLNRGRHVRWGCSALSNPCTKGSPCPVLSVHLLLTPAVRSQPLAVWSLPARGPC